LKSAKRYFKFKKTPILKTIEACTLLSKREKNKMIRYINSFYEGIEFINLPQDM